MNMAATATRRRKPVAKKEVKKGKTKTKAAGPGKFDVKQKPIDTMQDVDERVPALDEECQRYFAEKDKTISGREGQAESLDKIGDLLKEHNLDCYILNGKKFFFEASKATVKVKKVKNQ